MSTVSTKAQTPKAQNTERRGFYRVNDAIALQAQKLDSEQLMVSKNRLFEREHEQQALAVKDGGAASLQMALRDVEVKHPEVANLFRLLESRIESLARVVSSQGARADETPNAVVNMSGKGLGFDWPVAFYEGEHLLLNMTLFPARYPIEAIARVVRGNPANRSTDGNFRCALEFVEITPTDREVLLQHIHGLQLEALRSRNDAEYAA